MSFNLNPHILRYIEQVENGEIRACEDQHLLVSYVRDCFENEDIYVDEEQLEHYISLAEYFPFERLFPWEEFVEALHLCTYWKESGMPRWPDLFCLIGRGAGKDGVIAHESVCLMSPYNGIRSYDVDICANNEDQAMRPLKDVIEAFETPGIIRKLKKFFYWTKEEVRCLKTNSVLKGRTNSPKGKDGLRSGAVMFNEIHQYEDYANINVFTTGLGKKKHPRRGYFTTNGDVRDGPLDELIATSEMILRRECPDDGLLPFVCRLNDKSEVDDPKNWEMANPSLPYLPNLRMEIEKEYKSWKKHPKQLPAFMTKRMNVPQTAVAAPVTEWENIEATNKPLPELRGWDCTVGVDYASLRDWAAVNFHFRKGEQRYDYGKYWVCTKNPDLSRVKPPWKDWAQCVPVDEVEISPDLLTDYIFKEAQNFTVKKLALDNFRYALMKDALEKIGFDPKDRKNLYLIRPSDIMKVQPVVDSCFNKGLFSWGDNPPLRWATNNTKLVRSGKKEGTDTGNFYYAKIEAKSRKTDPFMALVASMVIEDELPAGESTFDDLPVIVC